MNEMIYKVGQIAVCGVLIALGDLILRWAFSSLDIDEDVAFWVYRATFSLMSVVVILIVMQIIGE